MDDLNKVSIPQAVSTVATALGFLNVDDYDSFNTASGKYCCNMISLYIREDPIYCFNTASGKYCCNFLILL